MILDIVFEQYPRSFQSITELKVIVALSFGVHLLARVPRIKLSPIRWLAPTITEHLIMHPSANFSLNPLIN